MNVTHCIFIFQETTDHTSYDQPEPELESDVVPHLYAIVKSEAITANCDRTVQNTDFSDYPSGMDTGFPIGGGVNPPGGGRQHTNLPDLSKNCMKL